MTECKEHKKAVQQTTYLDGDQQDETPPTFIVWKVSRKNENLFNFKGITPRKKRIRLTLTIISVKQQCLTVCRHFTGRVRILAPSFDMLQAQANTNRSPNFVIVQRWSFTDSKSLSFLSNFHNTYPGPNHTEIPNPIRKLKRFPKSGRVSRIELSGSRRVHKISVSHLSMYLNKMAYANLACGVAEARKAFSFILFPSWSRAKHAFRCHWERFFGGQPPPDKLKQVKKRTTTHRSLQHWCSGGQETRRVWFPATLKIQWRKAWTMSKQPLARHIYNGGRAHYVIESKVQSKPFWLATQQYPQNDWLGGILPYTMTYAHGPHSTISGTDTDFFFRAGKHVPVHGQATTEQFFSCIREFKICSLCS